MKSNLIITQLKMSCDLSFLPCHFFPFSSPLGRGPQTKFVDRENLGLKMAIAHFQKEWKPGARVGARSIMGSFGGARHFSTLGAALPRPPPQPFHN